MHRSSHLAFTIQYIIRYIYIGVRLKIAYSIYGVLKSSINHEPSTMSALNFFQADLQSVNYTPSLFLWQVFAHVKNLLTFAARK